MSEPTVALAAFLAGPAITAAVEALAPVRELRALGELSDAASDTVVVADASILDGQSPEGVPTARHYVFVIVGPERDDAWNEHAFLHLPENAGPRSIASAVRRAIEEIHQRNRGADLESLLRQRNQELEAINKIGIALSTVRDHHTLLEMILTKCREISRADAGSLYLLEKTDGAERMLRWTHAQNDSVDVDFEERSLSITRKSIAGTVALTGETIVLDDAYNPPPAAEYEINRSFDLGNGYLTRSMVVLPMTNHEDETIGVLQLINRRRQGAPERLTAATVPEWVIPFDPQTIHLVRSLTSQAAVALENSLLYESINRLFESFVTASVTAIEQRDPTTSGHSSRVAQLTCELAQVIDSASDGRLADVRFSPDQMREIRYASLLHDFGKVGVREKVLVKEKKLYPLQLDTIRSRFDALIRDIRLEAEREKNRYLIQNGRSGYEEFAAEVDRRAAEQLRLIETDYRLILESNEPTVLPEGNFEALERIANRSVDSWTGEVVPLLRQEEVRYLSIRRGNLDPEERREIESHVTNTFHFLSKIPWTRDLEGVPLIASAHHEKVNGRGYPHGLQGDQIPLQSRMMTVSDIYDALTAADRPYKKAVPLERALDILQMEMRDGLLDGDVVNIFIDSRIWERVTQSVSPP